MRFLLSPAYSNNNHGQLLSSLLHTASVPGTVLGASLYDMTIVILLMEN